MSFIGLDILQISYRYLTCGFSQNYGKTKVVDSDHDLPLEETLTQLLIKIKITATIIYSQKKCLSISKKVSANLFGSMIILRFGETKVAKE